MCCLYFTVEKSTKQAASCLTKYSIPEDGTRQMVLMNSSVKISSENLYFSEDDLFKVKK
jgi:hypothetical protein